MAGTQIQCSSLLTGFWWLTPYSPSQSLTLRMRGTPGGGASGGHQAAKLAERARLDLADAFRGHAVLVGELVQGGLVFRHPAPLHDVAAALIEAAQRTVQAIRGVVGALRVFPLRGGGGSGRPGLWAASSAAPGAESTDGPRAASRFSISVTSATVTPRSRATAAVSSADSQVRIVFRRRRLKTSLRCALVVAIFTSRQLRSTYS